MLLRYRCLTPLLLAGCHAAAPAHRAITARDSAGITLIESTAPAWSAGGAWRLDTLPVLRIGQQEGDAHFLFAGIAGALRLSDGRIVVADRSSSQLRFYQPDGAFQRAVGRSGEGPGEYHYLRALARCGSDSLFAFNIDYSANVVDTAGALLGVWKPLMHGTQLSDQAYNLSCSRHGVFVAVGWEHPGTGPRIGFYRALSPMWLWREAAGDARHVRQPVELGEFPSSERIGTEHGSRPHPFGRSTLLAIAGHTVIVGDEETLGYREYGLDGLLQRIVRGPWQDLTIRPEHVAAYREQRLALAEPESRPAIERELRDMPLPPSFPAYTALQTDTAGDVWLRRYLPPGVGGQRWVVFAADGTCLGEVPMPPALTVLEIGTDYVLGVLQDELGVERVALYRLLKP